jgi:hypothetical protein
MAVTNYSISVTTTQVNTKIDAVKGYLLINDGPDDVYWSDDATLTTLTTGAALKASDPPLSINDYTDVLRAVTASGTATLRVFALK